MKKTNKKSDPGDQPGDVIASGGYFCKVNYFELTDVRSHKYEIAQMLDAILDFDNIIVIHDLT